MGRKTKRDIFKKNEQLRDFNICLACQDIQSFVSLCPIIGAFSGREWLGSFRT